MGFDGGGTWKAAKVKADNHQDALERLVAKITELDKAEIDGWEEDDPFWFCLRHVGNRDLRKTWFKSRLVKAIEANDISFFHRLSRELKRKPVPKEIPKIEFLLVVWWKKSPKLFRDVPSEECCAEIPPLEELTDQAIVDFFRSVFGQNACTLDSLRKLRQRYGLRRTKPTRYSSVIEKGKHLAFER